MHSSRRFAHALILTAALALSASLVARVRADNQSLETLLANLKSPNIVTRRDAARKLGERRVRNQLAVEALAVTAREDQSSSVRADAVKSLGMIKDFSAVPDMIRMLRDPNEEVRLVTVRSLVALYTEHDIDFVTNRRVGWNRLNPFLDTNDHEIVEPYIVVDPNITSSLGEAARSDRSLDVRIAAVRACGVLRARNAIDKLADALASDHELRMEVLRAFIKIGDPAAGRHLVPFFNDSDRKIRTQAMVAAGLLKYRGAVEPLLAAYRLGPEEKGILKKVSDKVKGRITYLPPRDEAALWALSLLGDQRAEQVFLENLFSEDGDRRQYAVEGFARMGEPKYRNRIAAMIGKEKDDEVRLAAYWATYKLGDAGSLTFVANKLDSGQHEQAREYLLEANNPADLFPFVRSSSMGVRRRVIEILGRIGDQETIRELEPVTRTSSAETADIANLAIKRIEWRLAGRPRAGDSTPRREASASNQ
jgi:HEAT repeat protein